MKPKESDPGTPTSRLAGKHGEVKKRKQRVAQSLQEILIPTGLAKDQHQTKILLGKSLAKVSILDFAIII